MDKVTIKFPKDTGTITYRHDGAEPVEYDASSGSVDVDPKHVEQLLRVPGASLGKDKDNLAAAAAVGVTPDGGTA